MIKLTGWRPDTCGCHFIFSWDTDQPEDTRTFTPTQLVTACPDHDGLTLAAAFSAAVEENRFKNHTLAAALDTVPRLRVESTDPVSGQPIYELSPAFTYVWSYSGTPGSRSITVGFRGARISADESDAIRTAAEARVPRGRVAVQSDAELSRWL
jgi:hypothetical protein